MDTSLVIEDTKNRPPDKSPAFSSVKVMGGQLSSEQPSGSVYQFYGVPVGIVNFFKSQGPHNVKSKTGLPDAVTV